MYLADSAPPPPPTEDAVFEKPEEAHPLSLKRPRKVQILANRSFRAALHEEREAPVRQSWTIAVARGVDLVVHGARSERELRHYQRIAREIAQRLPEEDDVD